MEARTTLTMFQEDKDGRERLHRLPIYQKALEIAELVQAIVDAAPDATGDHAGLLEHQCMSLLADARTMAAKIAGAEGGDLYDLRMENAAVIRKCARDVIVGLRGLELFGYHEPRYFDLLRDEMEAFRLLFINWVAGFDPWNHVIDRWGLFNPPGVGPFDKDPDDDLPFDPDDEP